VPAVELHDSPPVESETGLSNAGSYIFREMWAKAIDVIELLSPAVTGDALTASETINAVGDLVEEAGDESLQEKFDAWSANAWNRSLAYDLLWYAQVKLEKIVFEMGG
jgi:hypothetical protein